ncbi:MAG TPA: LysE family transporter [Saprospiraceae bacterium]|nr:LysE family transporter [Saprospiraceae bacterium]
MEYLITFLLAMLVAFVGFVPPGMLNMTALKRSIEMNRREATLFVLGAVSIILIQALLAVTFAKYLAQNPQIVENLTYAGIVVFLGLAFWFYRQATAKVNVQDKKVNRNSYVAGASMSSMNMLAIPFFLGYSTTMEANGWLQTSAPHNFIFAFGAVAGAFLLFFLYILFAEFIQRRIQFVARNINYILSGLFLVLAIMTIVNVLT